jgi:hypothetical protein
MAPSTARLTPPTRVVISDMQAHHLATVAGLHARRILDARALEASAGRHCLADPDRAAQARDDAAMCRAEAAALAALLQAAGAQVLIPDAGQLSLFGDGQ